MTILILSARLRLSRFAMADADDVFGCITPAVARFVTWEPPASLGEHRARRQAMPEDQDGTDLSLVVRRGDGFDQVYAGDFDTQTYGDAGFPCVSEGDGDNHVDLGYGRGEVLGGPGADTLVGGAAGNSCLVSGGGGDLLISRNADISCGSGGDTEFVGSQAGLDTMVGGTGRNLFLQTGGGVAFTGPGASTVVGGGGASTVAFEGGSALAYTGVGPADHILRKGASGGGDAIVGFRPGFDRLVLDGYSGAEIGRAVAAARHGGHGSTLSLSDGTSLTLFGVQDVGAAIA